MSTHLIHKTYGLEPPVNVKVLKDWRGWKKGDEFIATTQQELRGAILEHNTGNLEVEGFSDELVAEYNATQAALNKGFPTGPETPPPVMTYKDRPGGGRDRAEDAPPKEKAAPLAGKRKAKG